jgi:hypothetical protein
LLLCKKQIGMAEAGAAAKQIFKKSAPVLQKLWDKKLGSDRQRAGKRAKLPPPWRL